MCDLYGDSLKRVSQSWQIAPPFRNIALKFERTKKEEKLKKNLANVHSFTVLSTKKFSINV